MPGLPIGALIQATRIAQQVITNQITPVVSQISTVVSNDNSNTIIRSIGNTNLKHGLKPAANTPGVNGQMWYHPDGNLYVCVDAYSANTYYNWKRVQLVNL